METKQSEVSCERVRTEVDMENVDYVQSTGNSGIIALWWSKEVTVDIRGK